MRAIVHGIVRNADNGDTVAGAQVRYAVHDAEDCRDRGYVVSGPRGEYRLELDWQTKASVFLNLEVCAPGRELVRRGFGIHGSADPLSDGDELEIALELPPGRTVALCVRDEHGAIVSNALCGAVHHNLAVGYCGGAARHGIELPGERSERYTDERGLHTWHGFPAPPFANERYIITVSDPRYAEALIDISQLSAKDGIAAAEVELRVGTRLFGRITADQRPVGGAEIKANYLDSDGPPCHVIHQTTTSGDDGHYELVGLHPGRHYVMVDHPQYCEHVLGELTIQPEGTELDVTVSAGRTIQGRVIDRTGGPKPGVIVRAWWREDGERHTNKECTTDADGRYELAGLSAGPIDVYAIDGLSHTLGYQRAPAEAFANPNNAEATRVDFDESNVARVTATLRLPNGSSVPALIGVLGQHTPGFERTVNAYSDEGGKVTFLAPPGEVELAFVGHDDEQRVASIVRRTLTLRPGEERAISLTAEPTDVLLVAVEDAASGHPLEKACVMVRPEHEVSGFACLQDTDDKGRADVPCVPQHEGLIVHVGKTDYRDSWSRNLVAADTTSPLVVALEPVGAEDAD